MPARILPGRKVRKSSLLQRINYYLVRWLRKKYRRLRTWKKLLPCWERITSQYPAMFAHWRQVKWYWRTG